MRMGLSCCKCSKAYEGRKASTYNKYKDMLHLESRHLGWIKNSDLSLDDIKLRAKNVVAAGAEDPPDCFVSCFPWMTCYRKKERRSQNSIVLLVDPRTNGKSTSPEVRSLKSISVDNDKNKPDPGKNKETYVESNDVPSKPDSEDEVSKETVDLRTRQHTSKCLARTKTSRNDWNSSQFVRDARSCNSVISVKELKRSIENWDCSGYHTNINRPSWSRHLNVD